MFTLNRHNILKLLYAAWVCVVLFFYTKLFIIPKIVEALGRIKG